MNSKSKIGVFGILFVTMMFLLIPTSLSTSINAQQIGERFGEVSDISYEYDRNYAELDRGYDNGYYQGDPYYNDNYLPKDKKPKKVVCEDSGFVVNNINDCPIKCPDGLYVMQGMECPEIPELLVCDNPPNDSGFVVENVNDCPIKCPDGLYVMQGMECPQLPESLPVCDNGIVVNSTEFCPVKCPSGPLTGYYVMNIEQCGALEICDDTGIVVGQGETCPVIPEEPFMCDNGILVDSPEQCPEKCTEGPLEGHYVMNATTQCDPQLDLFECPNGIVVTSEDQCPQKCDGGTFDGFYVMNATTQCMPTINGEKSDEAICEFCINLSTQSLQSGQAVLELGNATNAYVNDGNNLQGAWGICSEEDPVSTFKGLIDDHLTGDNNDEATGLWQGFEEQNGDIIIGCMEAAGFTNGNG